MFHLLKQKCCDHIWEREGVAVLERFHLRGEQPCELIGREESIYIKREFRLYKTDLVYQ